MKEVYRTRDGRFSSRRLLWQGPKQPFSKVLAKAMDRAQKKMLDAFMAPNPLLQSLRESRMVA